jgi:hypothetical protein
MRGGSSGVGGASTAPGELRPVIVVADGARAQPESVRTCTRLEGSRKDGLDDDDGHCRASRHTERQWMRQGRCIRLQAGARNVFIARHLGSQARLQRTECVQSAGRMQDRHARVQGAECVQGPRRMQYVLRPSGSRAPESAAEGPSVPVPVVYRLLNGTDQGVSRGRRNARHLNLRHLSRGAFRC